MKNNKSCWLDILTKTLFFFSVELLFRVIAKYSIFSYSVIRIFLFYLIFSIILVLLERKIKKDTIKKTINIALLFLVTLYAWGQLGFYHFIGNYVSIGTSNQIHSVWSYVLEYFHSIKPIFYIIWIPFIIYIASFKIHYDSKNTINDKDIRKIIIVVLTSIIIYISSLFIPFMQNKLQIINTASFLLNPINSSITIHEYGTSAFFLIDLKNSIITFNESDYQNILNKYFSKREKNNSNNMTGLFKNKNLIIIMMESVNDAITNKELFPNFNELSEHSLYFKNNYSPRNSCATADAEFSAITSLYALNRECTINAYPENDYSESLFNIFKNNGYKVTSYHGYDDTFYKRTVSHIHMGSEAYYDKDALGLDGVDPDWPSDEELISKASDIFMDSTPFLAWITTISSHQSYLLDSAHTDTLKSELKGKGYSEETIRYLSKVKILDNALGLLLERLKETNLLDDTVIVLFGDHYPYALSEESLKQIINYEIDVFHEIERVPFIIYNNKLEKEEYDFNNSYMNLTPTIANLFDIQYDSRLYLGEDVFDNNYSNRLIFADGSWQDDIARFDAATSEITYFTSTKYTTNEIKNINHDVFLKKDMSRLAIDNNYFRLER